MNERDKDKTGADANEWRPSVNPWLIAAAVVLCTFMEVLDTTVVSVALRHMAGSLASTTDEATWVLTSYLIANAIILPGSGWFALRFGRKRLLMACTAIFVAASFLCGFAPTMGALILARVLQGIGGGALQPLAQAVLLESFPKEKRGMAMAMFGIAVVTAPVIGPTLGGWLTENFSWRWVFYINVPLGLLGLFLMARFLEDPPYIKNAKAGSIDRIGFGLLILWLATLQIVLDKGQNADWFAASWINWLSTVSVASLAALLWWELRVRNPLVDFRVFSNRNFCVGTGIVMFVMACMYGALTSLPLFLQNLMGYNSELAGRAIAPRGLGSMVAMPIAGALLARMDGRWLTVAGIGGFAASMFMLGNLTLEAGMSNIVAPNVLQGISIGLIFVPVMALSMATLPNERIGNASGVFNLMRNLGGSIGVSMTTTYIARFSQVYQAQLVGNLTPADPVYQHRMVEFTAALSSSQPAHGLMYRIVQQQAAYQAFMAVFGWSAVAVAIWALSPLLMKKVVTSKSAGSR